MSPTELIIIPEEVLSKIDEASQELQKEVNMSLTINTEEQYNFTASVFSKVSKYRKRVEEIEKEHTAPMAAALKDARNKFAMRLDPYKKMENMLRLALNTYVQEQERIARVKAEEAEKARIEAEKKALENKVNAETGEIAPDAPELPVVAPVEAPDLNRRTEAGLVHTRKRKVLRIVDFSKLDDKYKLPNEVLLRQELLEGKMIEGAILEEVSEVATR